MIWNSYFDAQLGILTIQEVGYNSYRVNFFIYNLTDYNCPPPHQLNRIWKFIFQHCDFKDIESIEAYLSDHMRYTKALKSFVHYKKRRYQ